MGLLKPLYRASKDGKPVCLYAPLDGGRVLVVLTTDRYTVISEKRFRQLAQGYELQHDRP